MHIIFFSFIIYARSELKMKLLVGSSRHVSIFPFIIALNLTVESPQLPSFKLQMFEQQQTCRILYSFCDKQELESPLANYIEHVLSGKNDDGSREREKSSMHLHIIVLRAKQLIFELS